MLVATAVRVFTLAILLPVVLAACSALPHRTSAGPCELPPPTEVDGEVRWEQVDGPCRTSWSVRAATHSVDYVEIDEQGMAHDREAMEAALAHASQPTAASATHRYVVVYIHGWHHNASPGDRDVQGFHSALHAVKKWRPDADVRGVYIGWRGSSLPLPLIRYATFWDRKNTSDEVGRGALLEFLLRLENATKSPLGSPNRLVLIGHSFGASVAFNALAHVYMGRFVDGLTSNAEADRYRGYGDLTVLINPAIEAMRFMPLHSAIQYYARRTEPPALDFGRERKPRLLVLTSEGDWATRYTFPAARFVSTALEAHNRISESRSPEEQGIYQQEMMDRETIANHVAFHTHWPLRIATRAPGGDGKLQRVSPGRVPRCGEIGATEVMQRLNKNWPEEPDVDSEYGEFPDSHIRVLRKPSSVPNTPYIVASVGTEIVRDHSEIGGLNLMCWITQLVDAK